MHMHFHLKLGMQVILFKRVPLLNINDLNIEMILTAQVLIVEKLDLLKPPAIYIKTNMIYFIPRFCYNLKGRVSVMYIS